MASSADEVAANEPEFSLKSLQPALRPKRRNRKRNAPTNLPCSVGKADTSEENENRGWSFLPVDIQDMILSKLSYKQLFQVKAVSKWFNDHISSDGFHGCRGEMHPQEGLLTALHFSAREHGGEHGIWQCSGYDLTSNSWKVLPPFRMLPRLIYPFQMVPRQKDYLICGAGGIMCANVSSSSSEHEKIIVFNPLTGRGRELPPLNYPRNPVLMHMVTDSGGESYKIVVAGSAKRGHEIFSQITEVFDSCTSMWTITQDLPGPFFALNEHQTGVYLNGILYCIAFQEGEDAGRGVVAFSVDEGKWLPHLSCSLPNPTLNLNIVQLVESNEEMILFSEIEHNPYIGNVEHRIDMLEEVVITSSGQRRGKWRNVTSETRVGSQAWYPEYTCVPYGEGKLCIFNTILHTGIVYDVHSGKRIEKVCSPSWRGSGGMRFYSMNPLTFSFKPSFRGNPEIWPQRPPDLEDGVQL